MQAINQGYIKSIFKWSHHRKKRLEIIYLAFYSQTQRKRRNLTKTAKSRDSVARNCAALYQFFFFFFFLRDFIFKKTLFEKLQYLKQKE